MPNDLVFHGGMIDYLESDHFSSANSIQRVFTLSGGTGLIALASVERPFECDLRRDTAAGSVRW
jgi:hypothetical protein